MLDRFSQSKEHVYNALAILLAVFVVAAVNFNLFDEQPNLALFGMLGLVLVFLSRPLVNRWADRLPLKILDVVLVIVAVIVFGYVFVQSERLFERFWVEGHCWEIEPVMKNLWTL